MTEQKAEGLLRLKLNNIMEPFHFYGLQDIIPEAIDEIVVASKKFHRDLGITEVNNAAGTRP